MQRLKLFAHIVDIDDSVIAGVIQVSIDTLPHVDAIREIIPSGGTGQRIDHPMGGRFDIGRCAVHYGFSLAGS
jgi:hypothetical protein